MVSLNELNSPQREAASTIVGPLLILAGAGSGKTRTITYRMAHMIQNCGISGYQILGISFTNKAAKEMKERVSNILGKADSKGLTISTFHSLCVRILKREIDKLGYHKNFSIYDTSDQNSIIRSALKNFNADQKFDRGQVLSKISKLKTLSITEDDFATSHLFDPDDPYDHATNYCYNFYQEKLRFFNAIDFDDILYLTIKLFNKFPEIANSYSQKYQYIMIDEYQDTNDIQFKLIKALTSTHNNLCVVGDDDQSIYAFRGADITNILNFEKAFSGAKVVKLEENYRSTEPILNLANDIIKTSKGRKDKTLWTKQKSDIKPLLWACGNPEHEAQIIADEILSYQKDGHNLSDIAILYRSNLQAPIVEDQMRLNSIPYRLLGGQKFYDKKEVKDLIAYLCVIQNPLDELSLRRVLNIPNRGIGTTSLNIFLEEAKRMNSSLLTAMNTSSHLVKKRAANIDLFTSLIKKYQELFKSPNISSTIQELVNEIDFLPFIDKVYSDNIKQADSRKKDVMHFIESASRFENYLKDKCSLKLFIEKVLLQDSQDLNEANDNDQDHDQDKETINQVTMMTLHSSKGLEFKHVYLIGLEEEILPHKKTIIQNEDIDEERRLCYVGITRAQQKLVMTYCKERKIFGKEIPRHKSRFLNDLNDSDLFIQQDRTTFGHMTEAEADKYKNDFFKNLRMELT